MIDSHQKLIPALVHKNIADDFEINAYSFDRSVQVNTFRSILKPSLFEKTTHEVQQKLCSDNEVTNQFISSVFIPTRMKVVQHQEEIEVRHQPFKKTVYKTSVTLMRRFEFEIQPFIEILGSEDHDENNNAPEENNRQGSMTFESTVTLKI